MKTRKSLLKALAGAAATLLMCVACDDTTGTLGNNMLPGSDYIHTSSALYDVTTRSVLADSVFAKTSTGYVGRFSDPDFGYFESGFLTELNCTDNVAFPIPYTYDEKTKTGKGTLAGDSVVDCSLVVYYKSWFGDSLNACRMSVYQLDKRLEKNRYTNVRPEEVYNKYDPEALLGRKAYTAYDTSVPDSVRNATDSYGYATFEPNVTFPLDKEYARGLLVLNREHPEYFKNAEAFADHVFKGVYVKSDYGDGTILYVDRVAMRMSFCLHYTDSLGVALKKQDGTDSLTVSSFTVFASTKEVVQANQFMNSDLIAQRAAEEEHTYLKSPAGIFTEATLPYDKLYQDLAGDTLNAVKLTFTNYQQQDKYRFSMSEPETVLLLRKTELKEFFENNSLTDDITSYYVSHNNVATNQYTFQNISRLVTTCISEKLDAKQAARSKAGASWNEAKWEAEWTAQHPDWDKVLLIPVQVDTYTDSYYGSQRVIGINHDLRPSYAKLKGGPKGGNLQIEVIYTTFQK